MLWDSPVYGKDYKIKYYRCQKTVGDKLFLITKKDTSGNTFGKPKYKLETDEEHYITYRLDASGNKHGTEKHYYEDMGEYPGGCYSLNLLKEITYYHGAILAEAEYKYYETTPQLIKEYSPQLNKSTIREVERHESKRITYEYYFDGHYDKFSKETFTGIRYKFTKIPHISPEEILKEICLFENGVLKETIKSYYLNGLLKNDGRVTYNYTLSGCILRYTPQKSQEEYFTKDSSGNLHGKYYRYIFDTDTIIEEHEYKYNVKNGQSKYIKNDKIQYVAEYIKDFEIKRTIYPQNRQEGKIEYLYNRETNRTDVFHYNRSLWDSDIKQEQKRYTIKGYYLDISEHETPIKDGPYFEYYNNGVLFLMLNYKDGILNGPSASFHIHGTPNVRGIYKDGHKIGIFSYSSADGSTKYFDHSAGSVFAAFDAGSYYGTKTEYDSHLFPFSEFDTYSLLS